MCMHYIFRMIYRVYTNSYHVLTSACERIQDDLLTFVLAITLKACHTVQRPLSIDGQHRSGHLKISLKIQTVRLPFLGTLSMMH